MYWLVKNELTWYERFAINVLKIGPIPKHIAVIMDGNRRFVKKYFGGNISYDKGFDKLAIMLQWCLELGINEVTVYAFSIENFKRTAEEVKILMALACEIYTRLLSETDKLISKDVCIRVIGNLTLIPEDVRQVLTKVMLITKDNTKLFVNVAVSYSSTDEITSAICTIVEGVNLGLIQRNDIDEQLITKCLYTNKSRDPDLLIRTSGESRLSNFLLWQIKNSNIYVANVLWPEYRTWHLFAAIFMYQRICIKGQVEIQSSAAPTGQIKKFLEHVENSRTSLLQQYATVKN